MGFSFGFGQFNEFILITVLVTCHVHIMQAELGRPNSHHPGKGKVVIYVDCSSTVGPSFQVCE